MVLNKFEQANLKRLEACVRPNEKKIKALKEKLKKQTEETILKIQELEKANEDFYKIIAELKAKESEIVEEVGEESTIVSEEGTADTVSELDFPELSDEGGTAGVANVFTFTKVATDSFDAQEDFPY
jgi:deoxyribodipyrimidine photolyase